MKHLFDVPVRGEGTCEVEAFWSYVSRLAEIHTVSVHKLLEYSYDCYRRSHFVSPSHDKTRFRTGVGLATLVRPNETANRAVKIIEHVTRKSALRATTFLSLRVLSRCQKGFAEKAKWCPLCMLESEEKGDQGYFKLLWSFKDMTHCQNHYVPLVEKCEVCGGYQDSYQMRRECVYCQECGASLGRQYRSNAPIDSWSFQCNDLVGLVETIAKDPDLWFPEYGIRQSMARLYEYYVDDEHPVREGIFYISHGNPAKILSGRRQISLLTARRLAVVTGVNIVDLLGGSNFELPLDLNDKWKCAMPRQILIQERRRILMKESVLKEIESYLTRCSIFRPPSLGQVARAVRVSVGYIQYNHKALANSITMAHTLWREKQAEYKRLLARSEAELFLQGLKYDSPIRSKKMALKLIRERTGLPKNVLREEINNVYEKMFVRAPVFDLPFEEKS